MLIFTFYLTIFYLISLTLTENLRLLSDSDKMDSQNNLKVAVRCFYLDTKSLSVYDLKGLKRADKQT
jgi:hypothetical protein